MRKKASRRGTLSEYVSEVLKNAVYEKGEELDVVVAEAPDLPGCMTQAASLRLVVLAARRWRLLVASILRRSRSAGLLR